MATEHPTSRGTVRGTIRYTLPQRIVRSLPRAQRPRCLECGCQIWSGTHEGPQLCWTCRTSIGADVDAADEHEFRLVLLIRLVSTYGEHVDLADFFHTTDRQRILKAVGWWRERGAKILGSAKGEYKIVGWRE